ncbi:helix-turn-helix domain-containing protein [Rhodococcus ruber]|uniref:Putative TetR family transcriptional regulator n=1 Tax=Rhodococcus ruber TaxID=1830 RepID=A0A098BNA5_9NOCA|nr:MULTISPECIES: TetR/AcrR family transcriptional regulator [Rhodococcus]MDO2380742.1 helix-turn-helix domain-containing protein [Rhodococcus ruber]AUM19352.1 TetR/AcrR family transcriptional regulator [Rhodococcus ruber]MBD8054883.1 TetR/AcrR family transcriptional regulator [Rhodococcus ruber]MCD2128802.1 TetR/AcrR family transcriptional regulator [Rhodococcus ruber]MCF8784529.1 TetR/AcrR family transcriptional regulator [Rhodococcus ruber]
MRVTTSEAQERARSARRDSDGPRRRELLDAARDCFGELGYERTTVAVITERAAVSRATFYAYFSSKEEVFRALATLVCRQFLDAQHVEGPTVDDLREVLRTTTRASIESMYVNGRILELIEHRARLDDEVGTEWVSVRERLVGRYVRFVERIDATGDVTLSAHPERIARTLVDAQRVGAVRLLDAPRQEQLSYIDDMIAMSERLIGFR